jgi:hypothetical protein
VALQGNPDPVMALVELLDGDSRLPITLEAVERRTGIPSSALVLRWGGLEGLRDAADRRRFLDSRPFSPIGSLALLEAARDAIGVVAWIEGLVANAFSPEAARMRRMRGVALATSLSRPSLAVAMHPEWAAELVAFAEALAAAQARGLLVANSARARSLLAHALLMGLVLLDVHPRLTLAATRAVAAQVRWFLQVLLLGAPTPGSPPAMVAPIGILVAGAPPMPGHDALGMRLVEAAVELIDGGGEGAVKALVLARAGGVRIDAIFERFHDLQAVVDVAQLQRLVGLAYRDTTAMVQDVAARDVEELRRTVPPLAMRLYGAQRRERRGRRLDALGHILMREALLPWAAERHAALVRGATSTYEVWNRAFGLALDAAPFAAMNAGLALGLAQVELVDDLEACGAVPLLGQVLAAAV